MYDFEMNTPSASRATTNSTAQTLTATWHIAAGPKCEGAGCPALPEYVDIKHTMLFDIDTGAASETISNAEFPMSTLHKYRSPERIVTEQILSETGEAFYCEQSEGRAPMNWNVTEAKKVGESLATDGSGKTIRHFTIETAVSELDFAFLTKNCRRSIHWLLQCRVLRREGFRRPRAIRPARARVHRHQICREGNRYASFRLSHVGPVPCMQKRRRQRGPHPPG